MLDQSAGAEDVRNAIERACADTTDIFYDVCDEMFANEDVMVETYLKGDPIIDICKVVTIC